MNILYLADPNSIHDLKWISYFSQQKRFRCYLISREHHVKNDWKISEALRGYEITFIDTVDDFSIRRWNNTKKTAKTIESYIKRYEISLIHIMYAEPNALWARFKHRFNIPMLLTTRGTDVLKTIPSFLDKKNPFSWLVYRFYKTALQNFNHISSTSIRQNKTVINDLGVKAEKTEVVRTGVDLSTLAPSFSRPCDFPYLFFPRNMRPVYNHEFALEIISQLSAQITDKFHFVFLDKDGNDRNYIHKINNMIEKHALKGQIHFLNAMPQEELFAWYKHASLVIMTTTSDGSPVSAMETILLKTPLLLPPLNYDADIFGDIQKLPNWQVHDAVETIEKMLNSDQEKRLEQAYNKVKSKCDRQIEMKKIEAQYDFFG